jgi:hypothetical protein
MDCKTEPKYLCKFPLETRIDDIDLPNKIKDKLNSLNLRPDPEKVYNLSVYFSVEIYEDSEFYNFPVELKQYQIDKLNKHKGKNQEMWKPSIQDILSQQLNNICDALKPFNINFSTTKITGENIIDDTNRVDFCILEDNTKPTKRNTITSSLIVPNIETTINNILEAFEKIKNDHEEMEHKKTQEKLQHTPNMKNVEEIFLALATAILEEHPNELTSPERLSREMVVQAQIVNDWPLEIRGSDGDSPKENCLIFNNQIDCPEFLVYVKSKGYWTLKKTLSLETAKDTILHCGYNYKNVEQVIVLHNLKNVRFNLFTENKGEIIPVSKSEAHTAKKLFLSWC